MRHWLHRWYFLYRLSDGPWDFVRTCFLNGWLNALRYHCCDSCHRIGMRKPIILGAVRVLFRRQWICKNCTFYLSSPLARRHPEWYIRWLNEGLAWQRMLTNSTDVTEE